MTASILQDLRIALRMMRRSPGFTLTAIAALAIGIGANTAIFSVVDVVLLKPLPFPDPARMVVFTTTSPQGSGPAASPTKFAVWRQQTAAFQDVSAFRFNVVNLTGASNPEQIQAGTVSADFFRLFGARTVAGRTFATAEDRPDGGHVVVLSDGFWNRRFARDPAILGKTVPIDGTPYLVIGILGPFDADAVEPQTGPADVWIPFQLDPETRMQGHYFTAAGRLKPGVTSGMKDVQLQRAVAEFQSKFPDALGPGAGFGTMPLSQFLVGNARTSLLLLLGAVGFVLLISCANVANLLLVRAKARQREIAVRAAIGAGRGRIVRQLLTESLALALTGGVIGLVLGAFGIRALLAMNPGNIPRLGSGGAGVSIDWRVVAFTMAVSVATGVLFGLVPAIGASKANLSVALNESSARTGSSIRHNRGRAMLAVIEIALALVLLVGAALLIRTFVALRAVDPGFDMRHLLTMRMSVTAPRFQKTAGVAGLIRAGADRVAALPGVEAVTATCCVPLQGGFGLPFEIVGRPSGPGSRGGATWDLISADYFRVFSIPVIRGRAFTGRDDTGAPPVVIINQAMARQFWPKGDPLSDQIVIGKGVGPEFADAPRQIVGVVGNVRDGALNRDPRPEMYVPWAQIPDALNPNIVQIAPLAWVVKMRGEPYALSRTIETELRQASGLPVARVQAMDEIVARSTARDAFNTLLLTIFGGAALLLAAIGIYGLMAYSVEQRTQEIGIRLALGADAARVRRMIVGQGLRVAAVGIVAGLAAAFGLTRLIASLLFGVTAYDPLVFVAVPVTLMIVVLVSVWLPARRAGVVDPSAALRTE